MADISHMLRLATSKAMPGMVLALPVMHPEKTGHLLLRPGVRLDADIIGKLRELKIPRLWITYPPTAYVMRYASPAIMAAQGRLAARLADAFDAVATDCHADFDFHVYADAVRDLIQKLVDDQHAAVFIEGLMDCKQPLLAHSANVCMLSLLMGLKLDGYMVTERKSVSPRRAQNIENLGVGALLHDIGMTRIDPAACEKWHRTFDESDVAWRRHTLAGFEAVRGKIAATAAAVVLHHHQRMDGSGFPRRAKLGATPRALRGSEIHIFSRVVAVADVFDRVRQKHVATTGVVNDDARGPLAGVPSVRALRVVLDEVRAGRLDANVFKALVSVTPAYAPGSIIELNDGQVCVVTKWRTTHPCSPAVKPLLPADDHTGEHALGPEIDLLEQTQFTVRSVDGVDVSNDNFHPRYSSEFDIRLLGPGMTLDGGETEAAGTAPWPPRAEFEAA